MNIFFYTFLFIFGTLFGSFASVIIYRLRSGEGGMWGGRSHCKTCVRNLSALELIPVFSWLFQGGKCRGCKQKISAIYPLLEVSLGILFVMTGYFLIDFELLTTGSGLEWLRLIFFLSIMFLSIIYIFYDILYLEIPESILLGSNILTFGVLIGQGYGLSIIPYLPSGNLDLFTILICLGVLGILYYIMIAGLKELYDCLLVLGSITLIGGYMYVFDLHYSSSALLSGTLAALAIYISFFLQIVLSGGRAMGAGDLRIAILMGLLVGVNLALPAWMICYLSGSIIGIGIILSSKVKNGWKASFKSQIPFGPFIALGYLGVLFFYPQIQQIMQVYF